MYYKSKPKTVVAVRYTRDDDPVIQNFLNSDGTRLEPLEDPPMTDDHYCPHCAAPIPLAVRERIRELEKKCELLLLEAQIHHGEDNAHKSTIFEIYQALGIQKGDWNGAVPVLEKFAEMEEENARLKEEKQNEILNRIQRKLD